MNASKINLELGENPSVKYGGNNKKSTQTLQQTLQCQYSDDDDDEPFIGFPISPFGHEDDEEVREVQSETNSIDTIEVATTNTTTDALPPPAIKKNKKRKRRSQNYGYKRTKNAKRNQNTQKPKPLKRRDSDELEPWIGFRTSYSDWRKVRSKWLSFQRVLNHVQRFLK